MMLRSSSLCFLAEAGGSWLRNPHLPLANLHLLSTSHYLCQAHQINLSILLTPPLASFKGRVRDLWITLHLVDIWNKTSINWELATFTIQCSRANMVLHEHNLGSSPTLREQAWAQAVLLKVIGRSKLAFAVFPVDSARWSSTFSTGLTDGTHTQKERLYK